MKKTRRKVVVLLICVFVAFAIAACGVKDNGKKNVTLKFVTNGGTAIADIVKEAGTPLSVADPTLEGYEFAGWFTDEQFTGTPYTLTVMPRTDLTLYAKWNEIFKITFNVDGGTAIDPIEKVAGAAVALPTAERAGYRFDGWLDSSNKAVTLTEMPAANITLKAKWVQQYSVIFYIVDGQEYESLYVDRNTVVNQPENAPVRAGYEFQGWATDDLGMGDAIDFTDGVMVVRNVSYYGKWEAVKSILHFNLLGGKIGDSDTAESIEEKTEEAIAAKLPKPTKDGCLFAGWYLDEALTRKIGAVMPGGENTAYACWKKPMEASSVDLLGMDWAMIVSGLTTTYNPADRTLLITTGTSKEQYAGVYRPVVGNMSDYIRVSIKFTGTAGCTVCFKVEGNVDAVKETSVTCTGSEQEFIWELDPSNLTNGNYITDPMKIIIFWCFNSTTAPAGNSIIFTEFKMIRYANENLEVENSVFIHTNVLASTPVLYFKTGETIVLPDLKTKPGYHVEGYYTDIGLTQKFTDTVMTAGAKSLYVKWALNDNVKLNFISNGGDDADFTAEEPIGIAFVTPTFTRLGYTFMGWYTQATGGTKLNLKNMPEEELTVYAQWQKNPDRTLSFDTNGGNDITPVTKSWGLLIDTDEPTPIRNGYEFLGWYSDAALTKQFIFIYMPEENTTVYAKWIGTFDIEITLNVGATGSIATSTYTKKALETLALGTPTNTNTGYVFDGWFLDSAFTQAYKGVVPAVASNVTALTVYAKWIEPDMGTSTSVTVALASGTSSGSSNRYSTSTATVITKVSGSNPQNSFAKQTLTWDAARPVLNFTYTGNATANGKTLYVGFYVGGVLAGSEKTFAIAATAKPVAINMAAIPHGVTVEVRFQIDKTVNAAGGSVTLSAMSLAVMKSAGESGFISLTMMSNDANAAIPTVRSLIGKPGAVLPEIIVDKNVYPGYHVTGWYTDAECTSAFTATVMPSEAITLYAQWAINNEVTINFANSSTAIAAFTGTGGLSNLFTGTGFTATHENDSYLFGGWYLDAAFETPYDNYVPTTNCTLYARWKNPNGFFNNLLPYISSSSVHTVDAAEDGNGITVTLTGAPGWSTVGRTPITALNVNTTKLIMVISGPANGQLMLKGNDVGANETAVLTTGPDNILTFEFTKGVVGGASFDPVMFIGYNTGRSGDVYRIYAFYEAATVWVDNGQNV